MAAETDLDRVKGQPRTATTRRNEWGCTRVGLYQGRADPLAGEKPLLSYGLGITAHVMLCLTQ